MIPLTQQVSSLELSQKLKELGVNQESLFYWRKKNSTEYVLSYYLSIPLSPVEMEESGRYVSAFTVAELGEMLPEYGCETMKVGNNRWRVTYPCELWEDNQALFEADTEADARAKMLIYLLENKLMTL